MRQVFFLLSQLDDHDLEWLIANGRKRHVAAGAPVTRAGAPAESMGIVLAGALSAAGGPARAPYTLECGDLVGGAQLLDSHAPGETVVAQRNATLWVIPYTQVLARCEEDSRFRSRFFRSLTLAMAHQAKPAGGGAGVDVFADDDEMGLDPAILDRLNVAGARFDLLLRETLDR